MSNCTCPKGLMIHPGAIGDCLLALPLASFLKQVLGITQIDWIGQTEYIEFYPGRTAVDRIRSIESIPLHRLFQDIKTFEVEDGDLLFQYFSGYEQVISFLGCDNPDFEQNLLYTLHCRQSAHLMMLPVRRGDYPGHISRFYLEQTALENEISLGDWQPPQRLVEPHPNDFSAGRQLVEDLGINPDRSIVMIHPGSGGKQKCWAPENFILLAEKLRLNGHEIIFLLGPAEKERWNGSAFELTEKFAMLSEPPLTQVLQTLTCVDGYIGNDSGITHLAGAMAKSTVAVFGPTNPAQFAPMGPKVRILQIDPAYFDRPSAKYMDEAVKLLLEIL